MTTANGYVAYYKDQRTEVYAPTIYEAQQKAAAHFKAKKTYEVHVGLAEKNCPLLADGTYGPGEQYVQTAVN